MSCRTDIWFKTKKARNELEFFSLELYCTPLDTYLLCPSMRFTIWKGDLYANSFLT